MNYLSWTCDHTVVIFLPCRWLRVSVIVWCACCQSQSTTLEDSVVACPSIGAVSRYEVRVATFHGDRTLSSGECLSLVPPNLRPLHHYFLPSDGIPCSAEINHVDQGLRWRALYLMDELVSTGVHGISIFPRSFALSLS